MLAWDQSTAHFTPMNVHLTTVDFNSGRTVVVFQRAVQGLFRLEGNLNTYAKKTERTNFANTR